MDRMHPGNLNSRVPDHGTHSDRAAKRPRYQDFEKNAWNAANPRDGGGGFGRYRGGGRSEHVNWCYGCGESGHIMRDCPPPPSMRRSYRPNFTSGSRTHHPSLKNKLAELEEARYAADAEMKKMKVETDQWRKAAKAIASVLNGGAEIASKTPELESLVLHYTNRASKRKSLGKIRKALDDCRMASRLDPGFLKACLTAGNCHLVLGELDDAINNYKKCLDSKVVCLDRRFTIEASDGIQNAEKVVCYINQSAELLQQKTSESIANAMVVITDALSVSCYSEKLLEMKGDALLMMHKYGEVVQMCEQTLPFAENNCGNNHIHISDEEQKRPLKLWRWRLMSMAYFHLANFDKALLFIQKYEQLAPAETRMLEMKLIKLGGMEKQWSIIVMLYVLKSIESRSFAAICLCNRAAAHQALGEVVDAIADCNLAIALDGNYLKAVSRRASLHEMIRDYEHAALDLLRLITLLEERKEEKYLEDLKVARQSLSSLSKHLKKGTKLDHFLILGLKGSESGAEIKKAYHKAALRHHPDKAGKLLTRCESGSDGDVWKEIFESIHKDADKLFKIIGEEYGVLSGANNVCTQVPSSP